MHAVTYTQTEKAVYPKSLRILSNITKQTCIKSAHQQLDTILDYEELNILNLNTINNDSNCACHMSPYKFHVSSHTVSLAFPSH
jgi:hypothetical protein